MQEFLAQFSSRPRRIILNRIPVTNSDATFITIQVGNEFGFPGKVWNEAMLIESFETEGYRLQDSWQEPGRSLRLPLFPHRSVANYSGYYLVAQT